MAPTTISLTFDGYWREPNVAGVPAKAGIYCAYVCVHNADNTVALKKLIYIGESDNARDRIACHERWEDWKRHVGRGQQLCFTFAPIVIGRDRAEAAMINHHKPPENTECKDAFPFDATTMIVAGQTALLDHRFTVYRAPARVAVW